MTVKISTKNNFEKTLHKLESLSKDKQLRILNEYGRIGVEKLAMATPIDSGATAKSWSYEIVKRDNGGYNINFNNSNVNDGVNVALILHTGHGTGTGGYVVGSGYITPVMDSIFQQLVDDISKSLTED